MPFQTERLQTCMERSWNEQWMQTCLNDFESFYANKWPWEQTETTKKNCKMFATQSLGAQTSLYPTWLHVTGSASEEEAPRCCQEVSLKILSISATKIFMFKIVSLDCLTRRIFWGTKSRSHLCIVIREASIGKPQDAHTKHSVLCCRAALPTKVWLEA